MANNPVTLFEEFVSWMQSEICNWKRFETLGEIKRRIENKPLKDKFFLVKYDPQDRIIYETIYDPHKIKPNKLRFSHIQAIFTRFLEAPSSVRRTSSHYQIQTWKGAPDKIATPAIAAVIWHWYYNILLISDNNGCRNENR